MKLTQYELLQERLKVNASTGHQLWWRALGDQGEQWFANCLRGHLPEEWCLLTDLWLSVNKQQTQIDALIITPRQWWVINVKNHKQTYTYQKNGWLNGKGNQFLKMYNQIRRSVDVVCELSKQIVDRRMDVPIRSSVVFVHPEGRVLYEVAEEDPKPEVSTVYWTEFIQQVWEVRHQAQELIWRQELDRRYQYAYWDPHQIGQQILRHAIAKPDHVKLSPVSSEQLVEKGRHGICCANCRKFYEPTPAHTFACSCGCRESKIDAIVRSVHEFIKITNCESVTTSMIYEFTGRMVHPSTIGRTLSRYFKRHGGGRSTVYKEK